MQFITEHLKNRTATEIKNHPFFKLMDNLTPEEADLLTFHSAVPFIHLGMTFRDINNFYFCYDNPKNEYEKIIDAHAREDKEHWELLLYDLQILGLNKSYALNDSIKLIWNEETDFFRKYIYSVLDRARSCGEDPFLRFVAMESAETTVRAFFDSLRRSATMVNELRNIELKYFGHYHIDTEIETQVNTEPFEKYEINPGNSDTYLDMANKHVDAFLEFLDGKMAIYPELIKKVVV